MSKIVELSPRNDVARCRNLPPSLPHDLRRFLIGLPVRHQTAAPEELQAGTRHPLLRCHALTGEVSLYLSTPQRCNDLSGVSQQVSERLIAVLSRHSIRPARLYRQACQLGDVLLWDNRITMHRTDHHRVVGNRILYRGMVLGEKPVPAETGPSKSW
jgi:taurine dioxygenase